MNGKTAKLLRKVALTKPYLDHGNNEDETKYIMEGSTIKMAPGKRLTAKLLKKFYKQRKYTTQDLREELERVETL